MDIVRRDRGNRSVIDRLRRQGAVVPVLPSVYAPAGAAGEWKTRVAALGLYDPAAVVTREAAAAALWWPELAVPVVTAVRGRGSMTAMPGFRWEQRSLNDVRVIEGVQFASPATTVLDLLDTMGERPLYEALRRRAVTIAELRAALPAGSRGVRRKRRLLDEASDEPWSYLEFQAHRTLRDAGVSGWVANHRVRFERFVSYVFDIAFPDLRLALELDGWEFHGARHSISNDRARDVYVGMHGWRTFRFDDAALADPEAFVASVRGLIASMARSPVR